MIWNGKELSEALGIYIEPGIKCGSVAFNSSSISEGDIFVALKGNSSHGSAYIADALSRGASLVVTDFLPEPAENPGIIKVGDSYKALLALAEYKRKKSKAIFVAVTGSVGKTTTKELAGLALSSFGKTYLSSGNFNNYLGLPISLASLPWETDYAIFEIGTSAEGEISPLSKILKPDAAIITCVAPVHIEFFSSLEKIADEKSAIFDFLTEGGAGILNSEDSFFDRCAQNFKKKTGGEGKLYNFGVEGKSDIFLKSFSSANGKSKILYSDSEGTESGIEIPEIPEHVAKNFGFALTLVRALGLDFKKATERLALFKSLEGRGKVVKIERKGKRYEIICDYYNASPLSMKASIEYFGKSRKGKKVLIIGDMRELGKFSESFHKELAEPILKSGAQKIICVGSEIKVTFDSLPDNCDKYLFPDAGELNEKIFDILGEEESILMKGSFSVNLKKVFEFINSGV